jgi:polyisoprenyl-teichoic acid--peptidoglycan teichoic acid transferase
MSDTLHTEDEACSRHSAGPASDHQAGPFRRERKRRPLRVALITLGSLLCLVIVAVGSSYAYVSQQLSSIQRLRVAHLVAATGSSSPLDGQTFLITAAPWGPTAPSTAAAAQSQYSNLVMLLHTNANGKAGGAVTIPGYVEVNVPGTGKEQLWDAYTNGGASLLVQTVTQVTGINIDHYARIDFAHITGLVDAIGGVSITVPSATESFGYTFTKGVNQLTGVTAIYYARDPAISAQDRLLRQENLVRAVMTKIANDHLLTSPVTMVRVLNAITSMLAVDSNLTNSDIEALVGQFGKLAADAATFVTAPTQTVGGEQVLNTSLDSQLWTAVKQDSVAAFAEQNPSTVTQQAAP